MQSWFENIAGTTNGPVLMWIFIILGLLIVLFAVLWFIRHAASGTFVAGGRNRKPRLAVLDAAAVDSRRRLVLVRRDDVEHLIMIGGPSDIVVEQGIRRHRSRTAENAEPPDEQRASAVSAPGSVKAAVSEKRVAEGAHLERAPKTKPNTIEPSVTPPVQAATSQKQSEPVLAGQDRRFSVSSGVSAATGRVAHSHSTSDQRSDPPLDVPVPDTENRASEREIPFRPNKGDIHQDLLAELEATLDSTRSSKLKGANADINETMSNILPDVGRHHR